MDINCERCVSYHGYQTQILCIINDTFIQGINISHKSELQVVHFSPGNARSPCLSCFELLLVYHALSCFSGRTLNDAGWQIHPVLTFFLHWYDIWVIKGMVESIKSFLLYILERNILNKIWISPFEKIFLFMKIFCRPLRKRSI